MSKLFLILGLLLALGSVNAATLSPELLSALRNNDGKSTNVIVYFKQSKNLLDGLPQQRMPRIAALKNALTEQMEKHVGLFAADVTNRVRPLPIANAVATSLNGAELLRVKGLSYVERVIYDAPVEAEPVQSVKQVRGYAGEGPTYGLTIIGVDQVRAMYGLTGKGAVVGHIDTGADGGHPELKGKIFRYKDFVEPANTTPKDTQGHGTHTAATIAGGSVEQLGVGIAPDAKLVVARAIGGSALSNLLAAMGWMLDPDGNPQTKDTPRLVSCSWHTGNGDQKAFYEALGVWEKADIIPNFSAGNAGPGKATLTHPKEYPFTFTSAASDNKDGIASFSSRGPANYNGQTLNKPEIAAPGVDVLSAMPGGKYATMSGTSMAAPHTAGLMALLLEAKPTITTAEMRRVLQDTAEDKGDKGYDFVFGSGRISAVRSVEQVLTGGKVQGTVTAKATGKGISGAVVSVNGKNVSFTTDAQGNFKAFLKAGSYHLVVSAFGFKGGHADVTVEENKTTTVQVALEAAEMSDVTGHVEGGAEDSDEERLTNYTLTAQGTPAVFTVDKAGQFSGKLPTGGKYSFVVQAKGYYTLTTDPIAVNEKAVSLAFTLKKLPGLLVVSAESDAANVGYLAKALSQAGVSHYMWSIVANGRPSAEFVEQFSRVLWFSGGAFRDVLTAAEVGMLKKIAMAGGSVVFSGRFITNSLGADAVFLTDYLKIYSSSSASVAKFTAFGADYTLNGEDSAKNHGNVRLISLKEGSKVTPVATIPEGGTSFLGVSHKDGGTITVLSFGIEGVTGADARAALMSSLFKN